jgi:6-phospho-3-hexuloisomerase
MLDTAGLREFIETIKKHDRIFLIGVGREGMATKAFAMRLMHMGKEIHWIWDDTTPSIQQGDLVIATLGDGQIGHINYVCERAKEAGGFIYVVTGSPSGKTACALADKVFFVPAAVYRGRDEVVPSFQPMGNLFEQCLFITFDMIIMMLVDETPGLSFEKMSARHRNVE